MSHDQNFKNLILDYPHAALAFFGPEEADDGLAGAKVVPVRQEQLKERLGDRFRESDNIVARITLPNMQVAREYTGSRPTRLSCKD